MDNPCSPKICHGIESAKRSRAEKTKHENEKALEYFILNYEGMDDGQGMKCTHCMKSAESRCAAVAFEDIHIDTAPHDITRHDITRSDIALHTDGKEKTSSYSTCVHEVIVTIGT